METQREDTIKRLINVTTANERIRKSLWNLYTAIERDRNYFIKAKIDNNLDNVRKEVNNFLQEFEKTTCTWAEVEILTVKSSLVLIDSQHCEETAATESEMAHRLFNEAREKYDTRSYFGYLDALSLGKDAEKYANIACKTQFNSLEDKLTKIVEQATNKMHGAEDSYKALQNILKPRYISPAWQERIQKAKIIMDEISKIVAKETLLYSDYKKIQSLATKSMQEFSSIRDELVNLIKEVRKNKEKKDIFNRKLFCVTIYTFACGFLGILIPIGFITVIGILKVVFGSIGLDTTDFAEQFIWVVGRITGTIGVVVGLIKGISNSRYIVGKREDGSICYLDTGGMISKIFFRGDYGKIKRKE